MAEVAIPPALLTRAHDALAAIQAAKRIHDEEPNSQLAQACLLAAKLEAENVKAAVGEWTDDE